MRSDTDLAAELRLLDEYSLTPFGSGGLLREAADRLETLKKLTSEWAWERNGFGPDVPVLQERYDGLKAERDRLRETNARLNRRCQHAESAALKATRRAEAVIEYVENRADTLRMFTKGLKQLWNGERRLEWQAFIDGTPFQVAHQRIADLMFESNASRAERDRLATILANLAGIAEAESKCLASEADDLDCFAGADPGDGPCEHCALTIRRDDLAGAAAAARKILEVNGDV